jgi:molybdate transport system regulatory protein
VGQTVAAVITSGSVDRLGLSEGDSVDAVIKATDVMIRSD